MLKSRPLFVDREWSPRVFIYFDFKEIPLPRVCGTDRISDHQTFSGFFKYEIVQDQTEL
jgi:hypothetical protein